MGALLVAASIVSGCDPYRDVIIQNNSAGSLVVRATGYSPSEVETVSVAAHSSVTLAHYGAGGNTPFLVRQVQIMSGDCSAVGTVAVDAFQSNGGTIVIGADLKVTSTTGGNPPEVASPATVDQCPLPSASDSTPSQ